VKWGFKANANRISTDLRTRLGLQENEALNCFDLFKILDIFHCTVERLGKFGFSSDLIETVSYSNGKGQFSATTIQVPYGYLVLYNQSHSFGRINSSLAHEASHVILMHEFSTITNSQLVLREFDQEKEDEANWLAGCLLLPESGLVWALGERMSKKEIAEHFNISSDMALWRYNKTGMAKRMPFSRKSFYQS
jgi:hypothetical protein